jgi:hypothetical protein
MHPYYQHPEDLDETKYQYKVKPYQCTQCSAIFTRLNAYLIHRKASLQGVCPDAKRLYRQGLRTTSNGYWHLPTQIRLATSQTEILNDLEDKAFSVADFKKPKLRTKPQGLTFDEMAKDSGHIVLTPEQIKEHQQQMLEKRSLKTTTIIEEKLSKFHPVFKDDWRERLEAPALNHGLDRPSWLQATKDQYLKIKAGEAFWTKYDFKRTGNRKGKK